MPDPVQDPSPHDHPHDLPHTGPHAHDAAPAIHPAGLSPRSLPLTLKLEYADRVTFALQQAGIPLLSRISLTNTADAPLNDLEISITLENGEANPCTARIASIAEDSTYNLNITGLELSPSKLAARTEAEKTSLQVTIHAPAGVLHRSFPLEILPFDHWPGTRLFPDLLAAFSLPNHPAIAALLSAARPLLAKLSTRDAFDGYQSQSRQRAAHIAHACFAAAHARNLGYINPPSSFETHGQRIRLADRLLREEMGCCLDLSLLLTAMWEQAGLHALVLLIEGHAMPALWTHEAHLPEPAIDDAARIRNLIKLGEIIPVESTLLTDPRATFQSAVESAQRRLDTPGPTFCAIDITCARKRAVRPLPLRTDGDTSSLQLEPQATPTPAAAPVTLSAVAQADRFAHEPAPAPDPKPMAPHERVRRWQSRLLDLSLLNRLINFRETTRTLKLEIPDLPALENAFNQEKRFTISSKTDGDENFRKEQQERQTLYSNLPPAATQAALLDLYRTRRSTIEETGANPLYLALGMLHWYESDVSELPRRAPILLLPVELTRATATSGYRYDLLLSDEPIRPNVTLLEKLRVEFGLDDPALATLPEDDRGIDVARVFHNFRTAIKGINRWEVVESAHLGLFSFNKFLMWRDLQEHLDTLKKNRLVAHLLQGPGNVFDPRPLPAADTLDEDLAPGDLLCTRDADSSQLAAIRAASQGHTFVLEGPPGTGKSQTIANMIADSIGRGKRVLFVAEKMAALGVVRDRLEKDGLGAFCLELHSAKASKKEVLAQLETALKEPPAPEPHDWPTLCADLARERTLLNAYVRALHAHHPSGETLYQVAGRLATLPTGPAITPDTDSIAAVSAQTLAAWRAALEELHRAAAMLDPVAAHDLRGIARSQWSFSLPDQACAALDAAAQSLTALRASLDHFFHSFRAAASESLITPRTLDSLQSLAKLLSSSPSAHPDLILGTDAPALRASLTRLIELGRQRDARCASLLATYRPELLDADILPHLDRTRRAAAASGLFGLWPRFSARRSMRPYCTGDVPPIQTLHRDLESILELKRESAQLAANADAPRLFSARWNNAHPAWDELSAILAWSSSVADAARPLLEAPHGLPLLSSLLTLLHAGPAPADLLSAAAAFLNAISRWSSAQGELDALLKITLPAPTANDPTVPWLPALARQLERWRGGLPDLNTWCTWRDARDRAHAAGLAPIINLYEAGTLPLAELKPAFERGYAAAWYNAVADAHPAIREFNARTHQGHIERFASLDTQVLARGLRIVRAALAKDRPDASADANPQSELGILKRELSRKARHMPTRRLIASIPNLLARLKPCFLMSPLSVAQYLDARLPPFDLVIFDEASQIPVWDSIGAIARGAEVIVVGDSRQLPPTSFFTIAAEDEEQETTESTLDDMESILQECNASSIPSMWLSWHYRSRHESLIAFSNFHYYRNQLHTFPSPIDRSDQLGVTLRHIPGALYDRGNSRTNRKEAELIVEEIVDLLSQPLPPGREHHDSIGVVTFNQTQQTLIEDLLDAKRRELPHLDRFFTDQVPEPVFVKNLENVQGDERDIIIFSVTYGPYEVGKPPSMHFGPLNGSGGERRLNVAVTRARKKLRVFSSIRADDIDLRRTSALGVAHFKTFLDYADRGPRAIAEATSLPTTPTTSTSTLDAGFEHAVQHALTARGWQVDAHVGCAGYRVDLAIRDPARPGRYLLGIECDGASYHSGKTARDRDRLRQAVLRSLGWNITRVWSTDWRINPARCIESLEHAIKSAQSAPASSTPPTSSIPPANTSNTPNTPTTPNSPNSPNSPNTPAQTLYRAAPPAPSPAPQFSIYQPPSLTLPAPRDIHAPDVLPRITPIIQALLTDHAPLTRESLLRTLADLFEITRLTDRARERLEQLAAHALTTLNAHAQDDVLWPSPESAERYTTFRPAASDSPESLRDLETIPRPELINAALHIVRRQVALRREELEREVGRLFGVQRMTQRARETLAAATDAALAKGLLTSRESIITLART